MKDTEKKTISGHMLGLKEHRCMQCGKIFYSRPSQGKWAYVDRTYSSPAYFCSWKCMRDAEKAGQPALIEAKTERAKNSEAQKSKLMFGQIIMREGVWKKVDEELPDRRRIVAVKTLLPSTLTIYPTVAEYVPRYGVVVTEKKGSWTVKEHHAWVNTGGSKNELHNVVEWYDDEE